MAAAAAAVVVPVDMVRLYGLTVVVSDVFVGTTLLLECRLPASTAQVSLGQTSQFVTMDRSVGQPVSIGLPLAMTGFLPQQSALH